MFGYEKLVVSRHIFSLLPVLIQFLTYVKSALPFFPIIDGPSFPCGVPKSTENLKKMHYYGLIQDNTYRIQCKDSYSVDFGAHPSEESRL